MTIPSLSAQTSESKVVNLSEASFDKDIKSGLYLVDFYADWCRPCKMMQPILEEVAGEYSSDIVIAKVNTDHNKTLSQRFGITGIPCMIVFEDGKEVSRIIGYHEKTALVEKLKPYFKD
ncbi:MAG: thioredoxin [Marinilabiliales bacterium]|nr:MAG: thioredoxin [Marinilabiliales bacterium]